MLYITKIIFFKEKSTVVFKINGLAYVSASMSLSIAINFPFFPIFPKILFEWPPLPKYNQHMFHLKLYLNFL